MLGQTDSQRCKQKLLTVNEKIPFFQKITFFIFFIFPRNFKNEDLVKWDILNRKNIDRLTGKITILDKIFRDNFIF